jgi:predicted nucleic acid-binding protein
LRGYLLDTNIVSYWFDGQSPQNGAVVERIESLPAGAPLRISAISLGEIEFGFRARREADAELERDLRRFVQEKLAYGAGRYEHDAGLLRFNPSGSVRKICPS